MLLGLKKSFSKTTKKLQESNQSSNGAHQKSEDSKETFTGAIFRGQIGSKFSTTREYTDSTDRIISDAKELRLMQDFITQKIYKMDSNTTKCSEVDKVFKQALKEFNENLVAQYSVANKQDSGLLNIKYRDLIGNFEKVIETTAVLNNGFPLTMGVNAFRGFLNEFISSRDQIKLKIKQKKDKKRKNSNFTIYNGKYSI